MSTDDTLQRCTTEAEERADSVESYNDCLSSRHPDHTNFSKATKGRRPKKNLSMLTLLLQPQRSLFAVTVMMLKALKAQEAEPELWSPTPCQLFTSLIKIQAVSQKCSINGTLFSSLCNKRNLPSSSLAPITLWNADLSFGALTFKLTLMQSQVCVDRVFNNGFDSANGGARMRSVHFASHHHQWSHVRQSIPNLISIIFLHLKDRSLQPPPRLCVVVVIAWCTNSS